MKKIFTKLSCFAVLITAFSTANAQTDSVKVKRGGKNLISLSLTSLALNTYSFTYERKIGRKISAGLGVRIMPKGGLPFKSKLESVIDDPDTYKQISDFETGNYAITPSIKFYFGKDVFRGFYISPFARYSTFTAKLPFEYTYNDGTGDKTKTIPLEGELTGMTGGLLLGAQWKLSKLIYLDWSILGPHYGTSTGNISGKMNFSPATKTQERDALQKELEDLEIPLVDKTVTVDADGNTKVDFSGPWAGVRASIGLGVRF